MDPNLTAVQDRQPVAGTPKPPVTTGASGPRAWARAVGIGFGLAVLIGVLVTAFAWPATNSAPNDVPVAVVGPAEATAELERQLDAVIPDGFDLTPAPDAESARDLITDREVYGAIVLDGANPPQVIIASAASPAIAQLLQGVAGQLMPPSADAAAVVIEDEVPLTEDDPRGSGFAAAALPMVIGGMILGIAMSIAVTGVWRRVAGALAGAVAAGAVVTLVTQGWLGVLTGSAWANVAAVALTMLAISMTLIGLVALIGLRGIPAGAVTMFLLGNPLSAVASAPELLPSGWGTLGQLLPPGAGGTLLRSTSYFDGAAAGAPIAVLGAWLAFGLLLAAMGHRLRPAHQQAMAR
jgi:hypothetical protein